MSNQSANHDNCYPVYNYENKCWAVGAFPDGDIGNHRSVKGCHLKSPTPSLWDQQSFTGTTWASNEDDITQNIQTNAPEGLLIIVTVAARWHTTSSRTGATTTVPMWYMAIAISWIKLGCHEHGTRIWDVILWQSSNSRHLPLRAPTTWQPTNYFNNCQPHII